MNIFCRTLILVLGALVCIPAGGEPDKGSSGTDIYELPLKTVKTEAIAEMRITSLDETGKKSKTKAVTQQQQIADVIDAVTDKDYPVIKGPASFSHPAALIEVELIGKGEGMRAKITMLGAWNLLETRGPGTKVPAMGSNRALCKILVEHLRELDPEVFAKAEKRYGEALSGSYPKEYRDVMRDLAE